MFRMPLCVMMLLLGCTLYRPCIADDGDPFLPGQYGVGHHVFEPVDMDRDSRVVTTFVWYPVDAGATEGVPIRYPIPYSEGIWWDESPYVGGFMDAPVANGGTFPLIVLSHGDGGVPQQFGLLGEVLASRGFVVAAPRHAGNSAGTASRPGMGSHRPADMSFVIDTLMERNVTPGDLLSHAISFDAIGVGGYSRGAATATSTVSGFRAVRAGEFDTAPDSRVSALILIDGTPNTVDQLPIDLRETIELPTLSIGGSLASFSSNSNELPTTRLMYGVDAKGASHNDFAISCQFLSHLWETNAPMQILNMFQITGPSDCGPDLLPNGSVQEIMARHATAFLGSHLGDDPMGADVLEPNRQNLTNVVLKARVLDASDNEWADLTLTDPSGRSIGVDPQSGEVFSDFESGEARYLTSRSQRGVSIVADAVLPGEYMLTAIGNESIKAARDLVVTVDVTDDRQHKRVSERNFISSAPVNAGINIDPLSFEIVYSSGLLGDFDHNGFLDVADIDALTRAVQLGEADAAFDINGDSQINDDDRQTWIRVLKNTWIGDANLDGEFNSTDLVRIFEAARYEQDTVATWSQGDWTGDDRFDSSDLVAAFQDSGYESGPRTKVAAVPEPSTRFAALFGLWLLVFTRRQYKTNANDRTIGRSSGISICALGSDPVSRHGSFGILPEVW